MSNLSDAISKKREDISQFVIHLTRDDRDTFATGGASAKGNFLAILKSQTVRALRPHCIFNKQIENMPAALQDKFNVACFTETPLNQLHQLVGKIPGRNIELRPYGFVFTKEYLTSKGAQPAIYINSYNNNLWLRESVDAFFALACVNNVLTPKLWRLLPFVNAMHEKYDFSWEREWRTHKDLKFGRSHLVCVVLPSLGEELLKERFAKAGIAVISPGWTYEQIVTELAKQQRATKSLGVIVDEATK